MLQSWLAGLLEKLLGLLGSDLSQWIKDQWAKIRRSNNQDKTAQQVKDDQGRPRDETVRDHEQNDINS